MSSKKLKCVTLLVIGTVTCILVVAAILVRISVIGIHYYEVNMKQESFLIPFHTTFAKASLSFDHSLTSVGKLVHCLVHPREVLKCSKLPLLNSVPWACSDDSVKVYVNFLLR